MRITVWAALALAAVLPAAGTPQTWRERAPMPAARSEVGVAEVGGRVFVVGGTEDSSWTTTSVTSYDPRTDRWASHAPLPRALTHVGVAAAGGKLYAFGGFTDIVHLNPQAGAYVYDPRRDRWSALPDMPERLGSVGVAAVHGKLHLLGGRDSRRVETVPGVPFPLGFGTVRSHLVFDPARGRWSRAEPLPATPRDHVGVAVLGDRVHVLGGRVEDVDGNLTRHDVYDARTHRWTAAAPLPAPRSAGAATVLGGRIVYAGGECRPGSDTETYDEVMVYHPGGDRWTTVAPLPQGGRHGLGAAAVGDRAYLVAGAPTCGGGASTDTLELRLRR